MTKKPARKTDKRQNPGARSIRRVPKAAPDKPARKRRASKEKGLQYRCQQWLEKSGTWASLLIFHVANERMGSVGMAVHFKRMGVRAGVADYLAFPPGRAVAIELKDDEGTQGKNQEQFQAKWEAAGHLYFIARTVEEFQGIVAGITLFGVQA